MQIAMLYAHWFAFGEGSWNTPKGVELELGSRGHDIKLFNLYHANGAILPRHTIRTYSNEGLNQLMELYRHGYKPDVIFLLDYGPFDSLIFDKQYFPDSIVVTELGDEPQSIRLHWPKAGRVHLGLSPDLPSVGIHRQHGHNVVWWTHWADQRIFYPRQNIIPIYDCVSTCGGRQYTADIQNALGDRFNNTRYYYGDAHAERLSLGKMVFQNSQFKEITRRVFEGMACGRMVITDRLPPETGMNDLFKENEDIVYYDNANDAIDKIKYYSEHDSERERIAKNGYDKVMANHTTKQRVDTLEELIKNIKL